MFKKNKLKFIISSVIILLPILYGLIMWNNLPNVMTTHFGADGIADGFSGKAFAVFGIPLIILALHLICLFFTSIDKNQKQQNPKALGMIFYIMPIVSLFANGIIYRAAFGKEIDLGLFVSILLGLLFVFMGNYLPKIKQNRTLGIKISWALNNEENWYKTHRFGGKVWVACGFALMLTVFLPIKFMVYVLLAAIAVSVIAPTVYSYTVYRQHQKQGIVYETAPKSKGEKIAVRATKIITPIILIGIAVLMFTGNIKVDCGDTSFKINASYYTDLSIDYADIDSAEYRNDLDVGVRTSGFGSARLLMGIFQNDEFGSYTLYAYTGVKEFVVLTDGDKTLVIGLNDTKNTKAIYDTILDEIG